MIVLSPREREVIELLCRGCEDKEMAAILAISKRTIQTYVGRVVNKLKATNRLSAVAIYVKQQSQEK